jgi:hypothetical protein
MRNQLALFFTGETSDHSFSYLRPFNGKCSAHFFGHIVGLIISEVVLPPQFRGGGNDGFEAR